MINNIILEIVVKFLDLMVKNFRFNNEKLIIVYNVWCFIVFCVKFLLDFEWIWYW